MIWAGLAGLFVTAAATASAFLPVAPPLIGGAAAPIGLVVAAVLVAIAAIARVLRGGIHHELVKFRDRWVLPDETILVVECRRSEINSAREILHENPNRPAVFMLLPVQRAGSRDLALPFEERRSGAVLREEARALARIHGEWRRRGGSRSHLRQLAAWSGNLDAVREHLTQAARLEQALSPAAEWLLDNAYLVEGLIGEVRQNLPRKFYADLPVVEGQGAPRPRIHLLAVELIKRTEAQLGREAIVDFLGGYQEAQPLTMGELWAFPLALRLELIGMLATLAERVDSRQLERERADFWAHHLLGAARFYPESLLSVLGAMARDTPDPAPHFAVRLLTHLHEEAAALLPVQSWLERKLGTPLDEIVQKEKSRQAANQLTIAHVITSMRYLSQLDWKSVFESTCLVDAALGLDPVGVYERMDFHTRDMYRHAVETMSRTARKPELTVAQAALEAAAEAPGGDAVARHVGAHLLGKGRRAFEERVGARRGLGRRVMDFLSRHPASVYCGGICLLTLLVILAVTAAERAGGAGAASLAVLAALGMLPASQLAVELLNLLLTRVVPSVRLPRLDFEKGIPARFKTLVVVPVIVRDAAGIDAEVEKLEVRYLANPETNLLYSLFSDFCDSPDATQPGDEALLQKLCKEMEDLNRRHEGGRFFLLHRERQWNGAEGVWMGWERKRGKIEQLNRLLNGDASPELRSLLRVGGEEALSGARYVITLDADTQLPPGTARRLVETIAHPLNSPVVPADGSVVREGYTVIQPRVGTSLPSANATLFSRLFADPCGADPYTHMVADVYQDLAGEGSYHGKGIYDVRAFHAVLNGRFPENAILSHDLIEGAHVRVAYGSDIELLDLFPADYPAHAAREHRWIRGDWQIWEWLLPRAPAGGGGRRPNPLSPFNRWKILDNLRRSLLVPAMLVFLAASWLAGSAAAWPGTLLVLVTHFFPVLAGLITWATTHPFTVDIPARELWRVFARQCFWLSLMPFQAVLALDAVARVLHRKLISGRSLLEWQTAEVAHARFAILRQTTAARLKLTAALAGLASGLILFIRPSSLAPAAAFIAAWLLSPLAGRLLSSRSRPGMPAPLGAEAEPALRRIARQTWRFFDDFVGPETAWLPPDNFQEALRIEVANRTSPTNIGLWLISCLSARDFGFLTADGFLERSLASLKSLEGLERYEGHLLNWYDIKSREPLRPRYVSTVDSGNLVAALWTLARGVNDTLDEPVLGPEAIAGLRDAVSLVRSSVALTTRSGAAAKAEDSGRRLEGDGLAHRFEEQLDPAARDLAGILASLRRGASVISSVEASAAEPARGEHDYWLGKIRLEIGSWNALIDRYLAWADALREPPAEVAAALGSKLEELRAEALREAPSLLDLAREQGEPITSLLELATHPENHPKECRAWLDWLAGLLLAARDHAREAVAMAGEICERSQALSSGMNFSFLFDAERKLFYIGYNVTDRRMDGSRYDLIASEARLASFVAIAGGQVPIGHWWALGRILGRAGSRQALLSWSGSMFEYLMPLLFQHAYDQTLLHHACRTAVELQIAYGRKRGIPWGISESAFSGIDLYHTYQYRAFGVPGLGLKRGLEKDLVAAPYATFLAMMLEPVPAFANLQRLEKAGLRGRYGFYEAIDYGRQGAMDGVRGVVIYAYLAHHQGMSLIALDNVLNSNVHRRRFHADPRVRAVEPLLFERPPTAPALLAPPTRDRLLFRLAPLSPAAVASRFSTPFTRIPRIQLLSNGNYTVLITNAGGGQSRWRGLDITRWRSDTTRDCWGSFIYIMDVGSGVFWSNTYQPVRHLGRRYEVSFTAEGAECRRRDGEVETLTEITVAPEEDVEVRKVTLRNHRRKRRLLELTSYCELALTSHEADRAHPGFNNLFVETELLADSHFLLAHRRRRGPEEREVWAAHGIVERGRGASAGEFETDRARFIGRGRTLENPAAMSARLSGNAGFVLDPIFSVRRRFRLEPGGNAQVFLLTIAADTRARVLELVEKFRHEEACESAFQRAWVHAQLELRYLGIDAADAHRFQQLAGHLLYPNAELRAPSKLLRANRLNQPRLWPYGISGDLPIVCVTIEDPHDLELVRDLLLARRYWRQRGLRADLVIIDQESPSYEQPLRQQLSKLISANLAGDGASAPGGIFLLASAELPREDLTLIHASARVSLAAAGGSLAQQLGRLTESATLPPPLEIRETAVEPAPAPLPELRLQAENALAGFSRNGSEYVITLRPGDSTPAPWCNLLANPTFGCLVSEAGSGFAWRGNSQANRLLSWSNDPVQDPPSEGIYVRDEDSGEYWTPTPFPVREATAYRVRHGQGYTTFECVSHGIGHELTVFVPMSRDGGLPVRVQRLELRNLSGRRRRLTVTAYLELIAGASKEETQLHMSMTWDVQNGGALFARNAYHRDHPRDVVFTAISPPAMGYTTDRAEFLGLRGSPERPAALDRAGLSGRTEVGLDPASVLQTAIELQPGEAAQVVHFLGQAADVQGARDLIARLRRPAAVNGALEETRAWWEGLLTAVSVETPEESTNFLLNRWLLHQTLSCRIWARSAFYQSGGAFGFRDQLQDVLALVYAAPALARQHILRAAACQFVEGDVLHWWHPDSNMGVRTRCSDDLLWLVYATIHYVRVTGDVSILDERTPFIEGRALEENEQEAMLSPTPALEDASLLEHCRRALERGLRLGPHGLPLIGSGDWNDGMNRVGIGRKGESVWLAWFLVDVLRGFAELCGGKGETARAESCRGRAAELAGAVEEHAWDGEWYLRAFFDDGQPIGSKDNLEVKIDSLPQSWAVISGAARPERAQAAVRAAERQLVRDGQVLLFTPPVSGQDRDLGYIGGYPPGVRENGGQYTHAAIWLAMAFARLGDGERAGRLLGLLDPVRKSTAHGIGRYRVEPYVVAADVYSLEGRVGQGGWTWYTGSSGWLYRVWLEEVLGLELRGGTVTLKPCIPPSWPRYSLTFRHGNAAYVVKVENPEGVSGGVVHLEVDGKRVAGGSFALQGEKGEHLVLARLGRRRDELPGTPRLSPSSTSRAEKSGLFQDY